MRKVVFTAHAKERCYEHELDYRRVKDGYKHARPLWAPGNVMKQNKMYHHRMSGKTVYKWLNGVLYTVLKKGNVDIIMTVTPKPIEEIKFRETHHEQ